MMRAGLLKWTRTPCSNAIKAAHVGVEKMRHPSSTASLQSAANEIDFRVVVWIWMITPSRTGIWTTSGGRHGYRR